MTPDELMIHQEIHSEEQQVQIYSWVILALIRSTVGEGLIRFMDVAQKIMMIVVTLYWEKMGMIAYLAIRDLILYSAVTAMIRFLGVKGMT
jgi:hypothetical protein